MSGASSSSDRAVSVIVPTLALRERAALLERALASLFAGSEDRSSGAPPPARVLPIVVVNGPRADPELLRALRAERRLRVVTLAAPDLPAALRAGRERVDTRWFAELDDDDVLLPGALAVRVRALEEAPECDAVVTNGFRRNGSTDVLNVRDFGSVARDPLRALLRDNWLLPGSWLCRTDRVTPAVFEDIPRFRECTYLALRLALDFRLQFLSRPTVAWYTDTPVSLSKSREYVLGQVAALDRLLALDLPADVRVELDARRADAEHDVAHLRLCEGSVAEAWRAHLRSLGQRRGWRYLPFTRRLLRATAGL